VISIILVSLGLSYVFFKTTVGLERKNWPSSICFSDRAILNSDSEPGRICWFHHRSPQGITGD